MNRVEEILKEKGITKTEFASMMQTSKQNVNAMFKNPTNLKLKEIADVLNVPIWQLFISPSDLDKNKLTALVEFKGELYKAHTIDELENLTRTFRELELAHHAER